MTGERRKLETRRNAVQGRWFRQIRLTPSTGFRHLPGSTGTEAESVDSATTPLEPVPGPSVRRLQLILLSGAVLLPAACTSPGPEESGEPVISRSEFVEAYVDLRIEALGSRGEEINLETRDRILGELGLTEDDLIHFVEVHGRDVQFMRRVWEEVDSIITEKRGLPTPPSERGTS